MKLRPQAKKGFTLIELLISVSIILIIASVTVPTFSSYLSNQNLKQSQEQVKNGLRDTQNRATSGVESTDSLCATNCYWAIRFTDGGSTYSIGLTNGNASSNCTTLSKTTFVSSELNGGAIVDVTSTNGCVFYQMSTATASSQNITSGRLIRVSLGGNTKCVEINSSGLVRENDGCT